MEEEIELTVKKELKKPPYNYTALVEGIKNIDANIIRFKEAIAKEEQKKEEFLGYIRDWEDYMAELERQEKALS